jgi:anti-sigma B factor antagonist
MKINVEKGDQSVTVNLSGVIDEQGAAELKQTLESLNNETKQISLNFSGVERIGSAGIGKLLLFYKRTVLKGVKVSITNLPAHIYDLFVDLKLDSLFNMSRG